ncbi:hypothetical protein HPP92_017935 [Vanilla planifolia]|uniref:Uncharacterized protein n=1 Tax=Vanilla planifolia TaxID=51239 RepID=A0A835UNW9_VANPL|nr:hypothetical protein HPP92_017935 [Vanilla planifolia]
MDLGFVCSSSSHLLLFLIIFIFQEKCPIHQFIRLYFIYYFDLFSIKFFSLSRSAQAVTTIDLKHGQASAIGDRMMPFSETKQLETIPSTPRLRRLNFCYLSSRD